MEKNKYFPKPLVVRFLDGRLWELIEPFEYHSDKWGIIKISALFVFDFASIPRFAWSIIGSPTGRYGPAALVHDFILAKEIYPRKIADRIFLEAMKNCNIPYFKRMIMYFAVRLWSFF